MGAKRSLRESNSTQALKKPAADLGPAVSLSHVKVAYSKNAILIKSQAKQAQAHRWGVFALFGLVRWRGSCLVFLFCLSGFVLCPRFSLLSLSRWVLACVAPLRRHAGFLDAAFRQNWIHWCLRQWRRRVRWNVRTGRVQVYWVFRDVRWLDGRHISRRAVWAVSVRHRVRTIWLVLLLVGGQRWRGGAGLVSGEGALLQRAGRRRQSLGVVSQSWAGRIIRGLWGVWPNRPVLQLALPLQQRLRERERERNVFITYSLVVWQEFISSKFDSLRHK